MRVAQSYTRFEPQNSESFARKAILNFHKTILTKQSVSTSDM